MCHGCTVESFRFWSRVPMIFGQKSKNSKEIIVNILWIQWINDSLWMTVHDHDFCNKLVLKLKLPKNVLETIIFHWKKNKKDSNGFWNSFWKSNIPWILVTTKVNSVQEACAKCFAVHILKFEILQTTWKDKTKNIKMLDLLSSEKLKSKGLISLFHFFHVICKISNFNMWTAKHLAQASCTELTLLNPRHFTFKQFLLLWKSKSNMGYMHLEEVIMMLYISDCNIQNFNGSIYRKHIRLTRATFLFKLWKNLLVLI